jgi:hypothetical protein
MDNKIARKSKEKLNFSTLDHEASFNEGRSNMLIKRMQKRKNQTLHE